ncbi:MAG: M42 family metallopeptidase [Clostridiaceae bacterium]|jgi:putative aminopeptidase FrvX|nr:M42 family metallopeptidase [Clostridiaceae bacterium]
MKEALSNLKKLTALDGVSGEEKPVRDYIVSKIKDYVDDYYVDNLGNLITYKRGAGNGPKVMLDAHMDEIGLMVTQINSDGLLKFRTIGGIEARVLVGKRVRIGENGVPGVIGLKPLHLQSPKERGGTVDKKQLTIDIGAKDREQAESKIEIGDLAAFEYDPVEFGDNKLMAKALDDRVGCAVLIELLKHNYESDIYGCFTVQEEIGLKGAKTATFQVKPDLALILEGTTCYDVPDTKEYGMSTICGGGPALTIMDRSVITDKELVKHITDTAKVHGIPYQFKRTISGGTNAGRIQAGGTGVKVAIIALPCRYIHSPVSVMDIDDFENMIKLSKKVLETLPVSITLYREQGGKVNV